MPESQKTEEGNSPRGRVSVAGVARRDGKVLVMHRLPGGSVGGLWEFPGGKCEPGESPEEALVREWLEETDFRIETGEEIARGGFLHRNEPVELIAFEVKLPDGSGNPVLKEHDDFRWINIPEISGLDLVESDQIVVKALVESLPE